MATLASGALGVPADPFGALPRDRLRARLDEGLARGARLLLLLAPAGFGKTSLLAAWSRACGRRVAWLSLGEGDARPALFASRVESALEGAGEGSVLVLDDWHLAEAEENAALLLGLVEAGPPGLVLALGSRAAPRLPLARLRARGLLAELGAEDLRFDHAEARAFLSGALGLELPAARADALGDRVEGWAAGLRLAGLVLRGARDTEAGLASFSGGHPFVFDYLAEEVLSREAPGRRAALLALSVPPRLCPALAEAVAGPLLGRPAADFLEELARSGLFLAPLEGIPGWYRFHQLFADFLRNLAEREAPGLPPEARPEAARRAAASWLLAEGEAEEALSLAFAGLRGGPGGAGGGAAAEAVRADAGAERGSGAGGEAPGAAGPRGDAASFAAGVLEAAWPLLDARLLSGLSLDYARLLPETELLRRPSLAVGLGWALMNEGRAAEAEARLAATEASLLGAAEGEAGRDGPAAADAATGGEAGLRGRIALGRSYCALSLGRPDEARRLAEEALRLLPSRALQDRGGVLTLLGAVDWAEGRLESAYRAFEEGVGLMAEAGNAQLLLASLAFLADLRLAQGRPRAALALEVRARNLLAGEGAALLPYAADLFLALGEARLELGDLEGARTGIAGSDEAARPGLLVDLLSRRALLASALARAEGRPEEAARLLDEAEALAVPTPTPRAEPFAALRAELALDRGDLGAARAWAASLAPRPSAAGPFSHLRDAECLAFARVAMEAGRPAAGASPTGPAAREPDRLGDIIAMLGALAADCAAGGRGRARIRALVLLSRALRRAGRGAEAAGVLAEARAAAAPEGIRLPFLSAEGFAASGGPGRPGSEGGPLAAPALTPREAEILALVAEGLANKEIGDRLGLSLSTVKGYVQALFGKLPAASRTQAVARARELGLLP